MASTKRLAGARVLLLLGSLAACGGDDAPAVDAGPIDAAPPGGRFTLSWTLADPDGAALTCADVAGASVRVTAAPLDGAVGFVESFSCATGMGTSAEQLPGRYMLTVDLRTADGVSLLTETQVVPEVELTVGGDAAAGAAAFTVTPSGSLSFRVDAAGAGTNCGAVDGGNAGVVAMSFALTDSTSTCVDGAELVIGAGAGADGTYVTDCAAPPAFGCVESDQVIVLSERRSGSYHLTVGGQRAGALDCYSHVETLAVPGNSLSDDLGSLTLSLSPSIECNPALLPAAGP